MTERIAIGSVCEKGDHTSFVGEQDHGVCGSHYYATIYVSVEVERPGRGGTPILEEIAADLRELIEPGSRAREASMWGG